jgi:hypothetical protein
MTAQPQIDEQEWASCSQEQFASLTLAGFKGEIIEEGLGFPPSYEVFISERQWRDHFAEAAR